MKAHEIFSKIDSSLVGSILDWLREHDRKLYQSTLGSLAQTRKLRPVFVQRKSLGDQYAWVAKTLQAKTSEVLGEHLLQIWLMAGNQEMLATFCDKLGIAHDGKGSVEGDLPEELDEAAVEAGVNALLESYDPRIVTIYLHVFNMQRAGGWPTLAAKLESDARLKLA